MAARRKSLVLEAPSEPADRQVLRELAAPTVVVYGTPDDTVRDRPEAFARLVADFVERRAAFVVDQQVPLRQP